LMPPPPPVEMQPAPPLEPPDDAPPFMPPNDDDDDRSLLSGDSTIEYDSGDETATYVGDGDARTASSRFWGVNWDRRENRWRATYRNAEGKNRHLGYFDDDEEAARARDQAVRDAGLEGQRRMNAVDATGALVPRERTHTRDRSTVVAPDPARAPSATTSKFWGVSWHKGERRWRANYTDANGKQHSIGLFDTQEAAAHAVNAAIRRAGLQGKRRTNPVVDGRLVPRERKTTKKRRRDEPAATPPPRARRPRRATTYDDSEPDDDDDEDLELAPADDEDGWD
jgi:hypothetical protein